MRLATGDSSQHTIVNDLLDLSRIATGTIHRGLTNLAALVRHLGQAFAEAAAGKQIELSVEVPDEVMCDCDPVRLEQVV